MIITNIMRIKNVNFVALGMLLVARSASWPPKPV